MKVLMLGNSFTYFNSLDQLIARLTGWHVERITRGGAYLFQFLNSQDELNAKLKEALAREKWDYIVLQEQSNTPALRPKLFQASVQKLCDLIRENGAQPVLYATWAYREGSAKLSSVNLSYPEMAESLRSSYHLAAERNDALIADVGDVFTEIRTVIDPYVADDYHPSEAGSLAAAHVIIQAVEHHLNK